MKASSILLLLAALAAGAAAQEAPEYPADWACEDKTPATTYLHIKTSDQCRKVKVTGWAQGGVETFQGIPFAKPLLGYDRFNRPEPAEYGAAIDATQPVKSCMQSGDADVDEDCLTLTVVAPKGAAGSKARLPVMVWIYGGGFVEGSQTYYSRAPLVPYAALSDQPVILVTINYRVGIWGFGYGKEIADAGAANLGHRDQILALQWVQRHIRRFGGCKKKVMVFGQSAGAISIANLLLDTRTKLFRGAIMQSGAASTAPIGPTGSTWQASYDALAKHANCSGEGSLDCLRCLDADDLLDAQEKMKSEFEYSLGFTFAPSIDGDIIPDSPAALLHAGKIAKIPFITGSTKDEGTAFIPQSKLLDTPGAASIALGLLYPAPPPKPIADGIFQRWPAVASEGAPFGTGEATFGLPVVFKQLAAAITDIAFNSRRRWLIRNANLAGNAKTWTYLFNATRPGAGPQLGSTHSDDIAYVLGDVWRKGTEGNYTAAQVELSTQLMDYWIAFAYFADPNNGCLPDWPAHAFPGNKNSLRIQPGALGVIQDDFREDKMDWMNDSVVSKELWQRDAAGAGVVAELRRMSA
ncbi:hypothetical protein Q8F55_003229 [Vanrija albida]|uniref:Carboxylic ester hydrolase n=1 Tax=Vanrija albida TaxID=181172 RepID=A0ABR3QCW5_9TREE